MTWLTRLCIVPGLFLIGFGVWTVRSFTKKDRRLIEVSSSLLATALAFFIGVGIGKVFQHAEEAAASSHHAAVDHADNGTAAIDEKANVTGGHFVSTDAKSKIGAPAVESYDQKGGAGLFFSIYYLHDRSPRSAHYWWDDSSDLAADSLIERRLSRAVLRAR